MMTEADLIRALGYSTLGLGVFAVFVSLGFVGIWLIEKACRAAQIYRYMLLFILHYKKFKRWYDQN